MDIFELLAIMCGMMLAVVALFLIVLAIVLITGALTIM